MLQRRAGSDAAIARPGLLHACRADQAVQNSSAKRDPPARSSGSRSDLRGASEPQWCREDRPSGHLAHAFRLAVAAPGVPGAGSGASAGTGSSGAQRSLSWGRCGSRWRKRSTCLRAQREA